MSITPQTAADIVYSELKDCPQIRPFKPKGAMYMMVQIKVSSYFNLLEMLMRTFFRNPSLMGNN